MEGYSCLAELEMGFHVVGLEGESLERIFDDHLVVGEF